MSEEKILDSESSAGRGDIKCDIVVDPAVGSFNGGIEGSEHGIGNAESDGDVRSGESFQDERVGVEELDSGEVVVFEKLHHLGRRQRVGGGAAPVHAHALRLLQAHAVNAAQEDGGYATQI